MTVDIDLWVTATILRELPNNGLITRERGRKRSFPASQVTDTARRLLFPRTENHGSCFIYVCLQLSTCPARSVITNQSLQSGVQIVLF